MVVTGAYLGFHFGGGSSQEFFSKFDPLKIFLVEFRPLSRKIRKILVIFSFCSIFWSIFTFIPNKSFKYLAFWGGARARNLPFFGVWGGLEHKSPPLKYAPASDGHMPAGPQNYREIYNIA